MKTPRQLILWLCAIAASAMLAGCASSAPELTPQQKKLVSTAQDSCPGITGKDGRLAFQLKPVIEGKEMNPVTSKWSSTGVGDEALVKTLFAQRLCILEELATQPDQAAMTQVHEKYMEEISKGINAWPAYDAAQYETQLAHLSEQKKAHKEAVNASFSSKHHQIDSVVLAAAIPYYDFLHIKEVDVEWKKGSAANGTKTVSPSAKVCLTKDDFSVAIRPALDQTRAIVIGLGIGKFDEAQALRLMLEQIYEAGGQRLVNARDASKHVPAVTCTVSGGENAVAAGPAIK